MGRTFVGYQGKLDHERESRKTRTSFAVALKISGGLREGPHLAPETSFSIGVIGSKCRKPEVLRRRGLFASFGFICVNRNSFRFRPRVASSRQRRSLSLASTPTVIAMPSSLFIPFLLGGMILTVRLCCSVLCHVAQITLGCLQLTMEQVSRYAVRGELRRPRRTQPCSVRAARLADASDVWCVILNRTRS